MHCTHVQAPCRRPGPRRRVRLMLVAMAAVWLAAALSLGATIFATVRGIVHDSQHRPVAGATVTLTPAGGGPVQTTTTDAEGAFVFAAVPLGSYRLAAQSAGMAPATLVITVASGTAPIYHLELRPAPVEQTVVVSAAPAATETAAAPARTFLNRRLLAETPGADRTIGLAFLTDFVPGAVVVHDQAHIRGGHQMLWEIDGVPVPNTSIATNVGPQFDPRDIAELEVQRGGYSADTGTRLYSVLNVVPRSGFEDNRFGEFRLGYGRFHQAEAYVAVGSHTERLGWYGSLNGWRGDYGLETPVVPVLHDAANGAGGLVSLIFNARPADQLRLVSAVRRDFYQVPNTEEQQQIGIRDTEAEQDAFVNFTWLHTAPGGWVLTLAPFYHFNRAHYRGGPADVPVVPESDRGAQYGGGVATVALTRGRHHAELGLEGWAERDNFLFGLQQNTPEPLQVRQRERTLGSVTAVFLSEQYRLLDGLELEGGLRATHFSGGVVENFLDPRLGLSLRLPYLGWVLHGSYGRFYQPPPLDTIGGPLLAFAAAQGFAFLPLHGERDESWQAGLGIPLAGWTLGADYFHLRARNYFDHDALGNSNIFLPLTIETARVRGWELTLESPRLAGLLSWHLAFSNQQAQGRGGVTGGLTDFAPPEEGYFYLDHDQRNTLASTFRLALFRRGWLSTTVRYGSGFLNGDGPAHLGDHAELDAALGWSLAERWTVVVTALNATNTRYLLDNSNTFGGTHYNDPRQVSLELRYRFHF
jgi:hypothetical protein